MQKQNYWKKMIRMKKLHLLLNFKQSSWANGRIWGFLMKIPPTIYIGSYRITAIYGFNAKVS